MQIFFAAVPSKNVWLLISFVSFSDSFIFIFLLFIIVGCWYVLLYVCYDFCFECSQHYLAYYAKMCLHFRFVSFTHQTTLHIINLYKAYLIAHFYYSCNKLSIKFVIPVTVLWNFSNKSIMFGQCHGHFFLKQRFICVVCCCLLIVIEQNYINYR